MRNILVAVDLTDMDETVIRYAHFLKKQLKISTIHFVHNIKVYDVDGPLQALLAGKDIKTIIHKNLSAKITRIFQDETRYTLTILENNSTELTLKNWADENNIKTIVVGFKKEESGTAAMSQKLIRIFEGDILLVPVDAPLAWNRILVPTDLTVPFQLILKKLKFITQYSSNTKIRFVKSFIIPSLFFPFIDDRKAIEKSHIHIEKQYQDAKKKYSIDDNYEFVATYQDDHSVVDIIRKENESFKADLIIMTAKGASKIPSIFIGSTINEIINTNPFQAIYILK